MREFSRFYDKQEPAVSRLPLSVNAMLNLSIGFIRLCYTAAILSWENKKALFYHAKPRSGNHGGEACVVKQSFFGLPGQYGRLVTRTNIMYSFTIISVLIVLSVLTRIQCFCFSTLVLAYKLNEK